MTNTQSTNSQGNQQNSLNRLIESIKRNKTVLIGATLAGFMSNFIGFIVDIVEFKTLINPEPTDLSHEWVLVKITGYSVASYDFAEQPGTGMLKAFFTNKLGGISKLTPVIYTDYKVTDNELDTDRSQHKDFSVLKNVDYVGTLPGDPNETFKRNSQTFQARLMKASKNEEPVCLRVYGKRDNNNSQFFNIVQFKTVEPGIQKKYDELKNKNHSDTQYKELIQDACPNS